MNILKYLLGIFDDIGDDFRAAESDADVTWKETGGIGRRNRGGSGLWAIIWPQLVGAVLGLAIARIFEPGAGGYLACAVLFGIIGGTYKSVSFDRIALRHALVRNILIAVLLAVFLWIALKI